MGSCDDGAAPQQCLGIFPIQLAEDPRRCPLFCFSEGRTNWGKAKEIGSTGSRSIVHGSIFEVGLLAAAPRVD